MSDDADRPRKTLTLTRNSRPARDEGPGPAGSRRKRSGARAKNAVQAERVRDKALRVQEAAYGRGYAAPPP